MNERLPLSTAPGRRWRWPLLLVMSSCLSATLLASAGHETPINPDDPAYLRRQYAWFQSQDAVRQQQLRKLHAEFLQQDSETQARLTRVMQSYNAWLAHLDPSAREQVLSAPSTQARLDLVHGLREREWVKSRPRPDREEYERLEGEARRQKVQEWRAEEAERREEWALAQRHWAENPPGKTPPMFVGEGKVQVEVFVSHLRENLSEFERRELDDARNAIDEYGNFVWYALDVVRLADRHPLIPYSKLGPKDFDSLPDAVKRYLIQSDSHFRRKGPIANTEEMKTLRRASGRWPEFALEFSAIVKERGFVCPALHLGIVASLRCLPKSCSSSTNRWSHA